MLDCEWCGLPDSTHSDEELFACWDELMEDDDDEDPWF